MDYEYIKNNTDVQIYDYPKFADDLTYEEIVRCSEAYETHQNYEKAYFQLLDIPPSLFKKMCYKYSEEKSREIIDKYIEKKGFPVDPPVDYTKYCRFRGRATVVKPQKFGNKIKSRLYYQDDRIADWNYYLETQKMLHPSNINKEARKLHNSTYYELMEYTMNYKSEGFNDNTIEGQTYPQYRNTFQHQDRRREIVFKRAVLTQVINREVKKEDRILEFKNFISKTSFLLVIAAIALLVYMNYLDGSNTDRPLTILCGLTVLPATIVLTIISRKWKTYGLYYRRENAYRVKMHYIPHMKIFLETHCNVPIPLYNDARGLHNQMVAGIFDLVEGQGHPFSNEEFLGGPHVGMEFYQTLDKSLMDYFENFHKLHRAFH